MPAVLVGAFGGEAPKKDDYILGWGEGALAENIDFMSGKAAPLRGCSLHSVAPAGARAVVSLSNTLQTLSFNAESAEVSGAAGNARLLVSGSGVKPVWGRLVGGKMRYAPLSCAAPSAAPVLSVTGNAQAGATEQTQVFAFAFGRVYDGAESPLSATAQVTISAGQSVSVSVPANLYSTSHSGFGGLPVSADGGGGMRVFVYRAVAGAFVRIDSFLYANAALSKTYAATHTALSITAQFVGEETAARENMRGIALHPKGFAFGFAGNKLCLSAVGQYGVWPRSYEISAPEGVILAVAEYRGNIYLFPQNAPPRVVRLDSPAAADLPVPMESHYFLAEAKSIVNMGQWGLWYAAKEGIVSLPGGELVTRKIISERGENPFTPPTTAWRVGDEYYGARANNVMLLSMRSAINPEPQLGRVSVAGVISVVRQNNEIKVLADGKICNWAAGEYLPFRYKTGKMKFVDKTDVPVYWVCAGKEASSMSLVRDQLQWWASPAAALGAEVEKKDDEISLTVHTESGAETINLPAQKPPNEVFTPDGVDVLGWLANREVTGWVELEVETTRPILFMGVYPSRRAFLRYKQRVALLPPAGYQAV